MSELRLGLIGSGIGHSMAPAFHRRAGELCGLRVAYDLLEHDPEGADVAALLAHYRSEGYHALNVTYPFKQDAFAAVTVDHATVAAMGAVNTVIFPAASADGSVDEARGYNTDFTGLQRRWLRRWPERRPGVVAIIGTGGVGKASALAMAALGAAELRLVDLDAGRIAELRDALASVFPDLPVVVAASAEDAVDGADGVVNGTPIGMYFSPGTPVDPAAIGPQTWLFDAIYAPLETPLVRRATEVGLDVLVGFELFLGQGFDAFELFTGHSIDDEAARELEDELWKQVRHRSVS